MDHFNSFERSVIVTIKLVTHTSLQSTLKIYLIKDCKQEFIFIAFHSFD